MRHLFARVHVAVDVPVYYKGFPDDLNVEVGRFEGKLVRIVNNTILLTDPSGVFQSIDVFLPVYLLHTIRHRKRLKNLKTQPDT